MGIFQAIICMGTIVIGALISVGLVYVLLPFQKDLFITPDTLFYTYNKYFVGALITTMVVGPLCLVFWWISNFQKKYLYSAIACLTCGTLTVFFLFFSYTKITSDGVFVKKALFFREKYYNWNQIEKIDVNYELPSKTRGIGYYILTLEDGSSFDLWSVGKPLLHLDAMLRAKQIVFHRQPINESDYRRIAVNYSRNLEFMNDFILKIFPYQCASGFQGRFSPTPVTTAKLELTNVENRTNYPSAPNSIIIPVMTTENQTDFFYLFIEKESLKVKDLIGNTLASISLRANRSYSGPILIDIHNDKLFVQLENTKVEINNVKALVGTIQTIGTNVQAKYWINSN
jgi:hypothetical protein